MQAAASPRDETIVIGAGVAGLSCALSMERAGLEATVFERSRGVGGRCATRRFAGEVVDHGLSFLHGSDGEFVDSLQEAGVNLIGWPQRVEGRGTPCQPKAFSAGEFRAALTSGLNQFPKQLSAGVSVQRETKAVALSLTGGQLEVALETQAPRRARTVVLALALEQSLALLRTLAVEISGELAGAQALLAMQTSVPCLTVMASYDHTPPEPAWDICYPDDSTVIGLISHDSMKRRAPSARILVFQALPRYSREHLAAPAEVWVAEILREAGRLLGAWAATPRQQDSQRWRYARIEEDARLASPLLLRLPGGARLGLCGDAFAPSGGVEAAWLSGRRLAARILAEE